MSFGSERGFPYRFAHRNVEWEDRGQNTADDRPAVLGPYCPADGARLMRDYARTVIGHTLHSAMPLESDTKIDSLTNLHCPGCKKLYTFDSPMKVSEALEEASAIAEGLRFKRGDWSR